MRRKRLLVLLGCVLVATIGFGVTLPVMPFYAERFALRRPNAGWFGSVAVQVALLTAVYPLLQLLVAPLWGYLSDRIGRRRVLVAGIVGAGASYVLFAFATSLSMLYVARAVGGLLSSAIYPAAAAYVADSTTDAERSRGMAWLGTASSLGAILGPALGGVLARTGWEFGTAGNGLVISSFAIPFLAAAALAVVALASAMVWLPESHPGDAKVRVTPMPGVIHPNGVAGTIPQTPLQALLALSLAGEFGLAMFEVTFALFAKRMWNYGPSQVGAAFMVCGVVMSVAQLGIASRFAKRVGALRQIAVGFALLGLGLGALGLSWGTATVAISIASIAFGVALISPNAAALISLRGVAGTGAALGAQSTANGLGQTGGTLLGGLLFAWEMHGPFALGFVALLSIGGLVLWWDRRAQGAARFRSSSAGP
jgi:DHA1 family multidrug resistance protein-like MFS transporter